MRRTSAFKLEAMRSRLKPLEGVLGLGWGRRELRRFATDDEDGDDGDRGGAKQLREDDDMLLLLLLL